MRRLIHSKSVYDENQKKLIYLFFSLLDTEEKHEKLNETVEESNTNKVAFWVTDGSSAWKGSLANENPKSSHIQLTGDEYYINRILRYITSSDESVVLHLCRPKNDSHFLSVKKKMNNGSIEIARLDLLLCDNQPKAVSSILEEAFKQANDMRKENDELKLKKKELEQALTDTEKLVEDQSSNMSRLKQELAEKFLLILNSKKKKLVELKTKIEALESNPISPDPLDSDISQQSRDEGSYESQTKEDGRKIGSASVSSPATPESWKKQASKKRKIKAIDSDEESEEDMFNEF